MWPAGARWAVLRPWGLEPERRTCGDDAIALFWGEGGSGEGTGPGGAEGEEGVDGVGWAEEEEVGVAGAVGEVWVEVEGLAGAAGD